MTRETVLEAARGALAAIEASRSRIDDLNVYPVPDGDTGTNLALTVRAIVEELEREGLDDRASLAREVSRAALMGARGNSGVILSQIVRGAAEALAGFDDLALTLRAARKLQHTLSQETLTSSTTTCTASTGSPVSRSTS